MANVKTPLSIEQLKYEMANAREVLASLQARVSDLAFEARAAPAFGPLAALHSTLAQAVGEAAAAHAGLVEFQASRLGRSLRSVRGRGEVRAGTAEVCPRCDGSGEVYVRARSGSSEDLETVTCACVNGEGR